MGDHHKSNREVRKRKYAEQFTRTERNKKRKEEKRQIKLDKRRDKKMDKEKGYIELSTVMGIIGTIIIIIAIFLFASITTVPTGYVGIKTRFGQVQDDMIQEGFNFKAPFIESIVKIDCRTQKYEVETEASSKDLQKISNLKVVVNYNVDKSKANSLYQEVGKDYQSVLIEPAILESIKQGISQYTAEETITKRSEVADKILELLKGKLETRGVLVSALNITDLSFSEEFDKAVEEKQIVEQETQKAQYELEKAKVENEKKIEDAKAEAEVMRQQNSQITEQYLRLKEIENEQKAIDKWNGQLPTTTSDAIPFINLN